MTSYPKRTRGGGLRPGVVFALGALLNVGCMTDNRQEPQAKAGGTGGTGASAGPALSRQSQDALRDPYGYSPDFQETDISGGGLSDFDRDAFNKDLNSVFDP